MDARLGSRMDELAEDPGALPALLALLAPLSVVTVLEATGNVLVAFATYHLGFCLVVPLVVLWYRHGDPARLAEGLGLGAPSTPGWLAGIGVGAAMGGSILGLHALVGARFVGPELLDRLAPWGIVPGVEVPLFVYMLVFNSGAEELFWRGYIHTEATRRLGTVAGILVASLAFTSYHVYTLAALLGDLGLALVVAVAILAGALAWAGLRERYASVWPAVLGHVGATAGYMTVFVLVA